MYSIYNFISRHHLIYICRDFVHFNAPRSADIFWVWCCLVAEFVTPLKQSFGSFSNHHIPCVFFLNSWKKVQIQKLSHNFHYTFEAIQIPPWNLNHVISVAAEGFYCFTSLLCLGLGSEDLILSWNLTAIKTPAHKNQTMQLRLIFKTLSEESLKTIKGDSDYTLQNTVKIFFF